MPTKPPNALTILSQFLCAWYLLAQPANAETVIAVDIDSATQYIEALEDLPSAAMPLGWTAPTYDTHQDAGKGDTDNGNGSGDWQSGSFTLGYGENGISSNIDDDNDIRSIYTRTTFHVADPAKFTGMHLDHIYDDGYIAWLNGVEISRSANMVGVSPTWNAQATSGHELSDGDYSDDVSESLPLLVPGANVLAIGIWNVDATSSDLFITPRLWLRDALPLYTYLTWQGDTSTTMTVNYQTTSSTAISRVHYDTVPRHGVPEDYAMQVDGSAHTIPGLDAYTPRFVHTVELTGLTPDTEYCFIAGDPTDGFTWERKFRTLPDGNAPIRFVTGGDMGTSLEVEQLNSQAAAVEPQFALIGGDVAYANGDVSSYAAWDTWLDAYVRTMVTPAGYTIPLIFAIGNHEVDGAYGQTPTQAPFYFGYFAQGAEISYFTKTFGDSAVLYVLDTGHVTPHGGTQAAWLDAEMVAKAAYRNQFALYHIPLYPGDRPFSDPGSTAGHDNWLPIFDAHGLTTAFENHDHVMKRSKFLKGGVEDSSGTLYIGDGCWGRSPRAGDQSGAPYIAALQSERHFWLVDVPNAALPNATIRYRAIDITGAVIDDFGGAPGGLTILEEPAPIVEAHPEDTVTLSVVVGGETGTLSYEWMLDKGGKSMIPVGANTPTLVLDTIEMNDAGVYTCQVSDDLDTVITSPSLLIVLPGIPVATGIGLLILTTALVSLLVILRPMRTRRPSITLDRTQSG